MHNQQGLITIQKILPVIWGAIFYKSRTNVVDLMTPDPNSTAFFDMVLKKDIVDHELQKWKAKIYQSRPNVVDVPVPNNILQNSAANLCTPRSAIFGFGKQDLPKSNECCRNQVLDFAHQDLQDLLFWIAMDLGFSFSLHPLKLPWWMMTSLIFCHLQLWTCLQKSLQCWMNWKLTNN